MVLHENKPEGLPARGVRFETTHWSLVASAGRERSPEASRALATLCENYWFPLYAFVRQAGYSAEDAQDLTQEFFVGLLANELSGGRRPPAGKIPLVPPGSHEALSGQAERRERAQKRGGHSPLLSLDFDSGEDRYRRLEPVDNLTPERLYQKRWALALLELVFRRLREEFLAAGKLHVFDRLKPFLAGKTAGPPYLEVAKELGMSEGAVKVAVHRLRRQYRKLLKEEILQTIKSPETLEDELGELMAALSSDR